jgi:ferredoxin-NADP reductase
MSNQGSSESKERANADLQTTVKVLRAEPLGQTARLLEIERSDGGELGFAGGQYLILNTGVPLPGGKVAKRAYSLLSRDSEPRRAELAVKRIPGGPGSGRLHEIAAGDELSFSGPWGKLRLPPGFRGRALVVATDTGITAALGVVGSRRAAPDAPPPDLLWLSASPHDFVPASFVRERLPAGCAAELVTDFLPVGHPERAAALCALVEARFFPRSYDVILCAGDGAVIYPLRDRLIALGAPQGGVLLESFFNNPQKKSP